MNKKEIQKAYKWSKDNNIKLEDGFDLDKTFRYFVFITTLSKMKKTK